jgi:hypothetical protein
MGQNIFVLVIGIFFITSSVYLLSITQTPPGIKPLMFIAVGILLIFISLKSFIQ